MSKSDAAPIFLTHDRHIEEITKHWNLLWPLPRAERIERINDIRLDLEYDDLLLAIAQEMEDREPALGSVRRVNPRPVQPAILATWISPTLVCLAFLAGYLAFQMMRPL